MRVLFLANELRYTDGVTTHLLNLTGGLSKQNDIELFMICGGGNGAKRFKDISIKIVSDERFLHDNRSISNYLSAVNHLRKFIKENKINIVHSHSHYSANIAHDTEKITSIKTVQTNHGLLKEKGKLKHFCADRYVAINKHIYDYILQNNIAELKDVNFIRCGIPIPDKTDIKEKDRITVLFASRLLREKGADIFIKAIAELDSATKNKADFLIAGEGEMETELIELNNNLDTRVKFLGSLEDINLLLDKTHILVFCGRSNTEGFPAIITEAGAHKNLVISSEFLGLNSVIENEKDGLTYKIEDVSKLLELLNMTINNYASYKLLAENFYNKVCEWYNLDLMVTKHLELYSELINEQ